MSVRKRLTVLGFVAGLCVVHSLAVRPPDGAIFDHRVFSSTIEEMRTGEGYYDAYLEAARGLGTDSSRPRTVLSEPSLFRWRLPTAFLLWRVVPKSMLFVLYLTVVVGGTALALSFATERALPILAVSAYLLHAGNIWMPSQGTIEEWLLVELWAVPALAVALAASRRGRWWLAGGAVAVGALVRELLFPILLTGFIAARVRRTAWRPWVIASGAFVLGIGVHWLVASRVTAVPGTESPLFGSASFPRSVLAIIDWPIPGPYVAGTAAFIASLFWLSRTGELLRWSGLLILPVYGLIVDRPYWGLILVPLTVFWAAEFACDVVPRRWQGMRPR
jgi:hypothetical protein